MIPKYTMSLAGAKLKGLHKLHPSTMRKYARDFFKENVLSQIGGNIDDYDLQITDMWGIFTLKEPVNEKD